MKQNSVAELFYIISKENWGNGYAKEIAIKIIEYIFNNYNVHKIIANCDKRNSNSEKIMKQIGMKKEGSTAKSRYKNGEWEDNIGYYILKQ